MAQKKRILRTSDDCCRCHDRELVAERRKANTPIRNALGNWAGGWEKGQVQSLAGKRREPLQLAPVS